eukprot:4485185-Pyramimonas_sp.AAC.1
MGDVIPPLAEEKNVGRPPGARDPDIVRLRRDVRAPVDFRGKLRAACAPAAHYDSSMHDLTVRLKGKVRRWRRASRSTRAREIQEARRVRRLAAVQS